MYCKITVIPSSSFLNNWGVIDVQYCICTVYWETSIGGNVSILIIVIFKEYRKMFNLSPVVSRIHWGILFLNYHIVHPYAAVAFKNKNMEPELAMVWTHVRWLAFFKVNNGKFAPKSKPKAENVLLVKSDILGVHSGIKKG